MIQSLESYQLDDLPADENTGFTSYRDHFLWGKRGNLSKFCAKLRRKIGHSRKFVLHEIRPKMCVAANHFLAAMPNPLLDYLDWCSCHDQSAYPVMSEAVHTATFQPEFAKQWMKVFV